MKTLYLLVSMTAMGVINLALLKALEFYLVTEVAYGKLNLNDVWFLQNTTYAFPLWFQIFFVVLGFILGFPVGQRWWYAIYIEKKRWKFGINFFGVVK